MPPEIRDKSDDYGYFIFGCLLVLIGVRFSFGDAAGVTSTSRQATVSDFKIAGVAVRAPMVHLKTLACYPSSGGKVVGFLGKPLIWLPVGGGI